MSPVDVTGGVLAIAGVVWLVFALARGFQGRQSARRMLLAGFNGLAAGATPLVLGGAHLAGVVSTWMGDAETAGYDFRFYSLLMVGILVAGAGLACLLCVPGLIAACRTAWVTAIAASLVQLVVNLPMMPLQDFAVLLSGVSIVNLVALLAARRQFTNAPKPKAASAP